ncbi:hypothetical protein NECID01_1995 [Nematocida sp. AWRm77]|nr:hypothetical protein NECID01_1995 [Nematocida sp. AWRm77]
MNVRDLPSVSEVCGEAGSGRASFCLSLMKGVRVLWIERSTPFPSARAQSVGVDLGSVIVGRDANALHLLYSLEVGQIKQLAETRKVELIVLGEASVYTEEPCFLDTSVAIVYALKKIYLAHQIKSLIITTPEVHTPKRVLSLQKSAPWLYSIPARFLVVKTKEDTDRTVLLAKPYFIPQVKYSLVLGASFLSLSRF